MYNNSLNSTLFLTFKISTLRKGTMWKGEYRSMDKTKNWKRKRKLLPKKWRDLWTKGTHIHTWKLQWNISTITDFFLDQKNVCEHMIKSAPHGINLRLLSFNFLSISSTVPASHPFCWHFSITKRGAVFTMCSHTFTLFWSRKTSVIVKTFQLNLHVFMCAFH